MSDINSDGIKPVQFQFAELQIGEKQFYSFTATIAKPKKEGILWGFGPKLYLALDGTFLVHLTNQRIVVEPNLINTKKGDTKAEVATKILNTVLGVGTGAQLSQKRLTKKYYATLEGRRGSYMQFLYKKRIKVESGGAFNVEILLEGKEENSDEKQKLPLMMIYGSDAQVKLLGGIENIVSKTVLNGDQFITYYKRARRKPRKL